MRGGHARRERVSTDSGGFVGECGRVGLRPSADEVQREFDEFVASVNHCQAADECTLVGPGCPLGCWVAVPTSAKSAVEAKAADLIGDYERFGARCEYGCGPFPETLACREGRCVAE
ncbi:MAG TPA: hypothetical protein VKZ49_01890 [Polyangiaceae bacterium]|nr:hypothetical protein [Polyangiaceae bacterium]